MTRSHNRAVKTKLTITVDQQVLQQAKRHARSQGVSLSSLVEDALRGLADRDLPSFAEKWRGKFMPAPSGGSRR